LRLESWTGFRSFFQNLKFSYPDDFVADVGTWAGSYVGNSIENSVGLGENLVDEIEQCIGVKVVAQAAQGQMTPRKIWMVPPSWVVCLGVGIVIGSRIGCIHVL